jgi:hypothetical protein
MAARLSVSAATISRIEGGQRLIKSSELNTWLTVAQAADAVRDELNTLVVSSVNQVTPWRLREAADPERIQDDVGQVETAAALVQAYEHACVHGLLQTREYAKLIMGLSATIPAPDIDARVSARLRRQAVLLDQSRRFELLMTEAALRWRPGSIDLQRRQIRHIQATMRLPNVTVGILPMNGQSSVIHPEGFTVYGVPDSDSIAVIELVTDEVTISDPESVALYSHEFDRLTNSAIRGDGAEALLESVAESL